MIGPADVFLFGAVLTILFFTLIRVMMSHPESKVGYYWRTGWFQPILFHRFWCKEHGWVVNYPSGWKLKLFCPLCDMVEWRTSQIDAPIKGVICGTSDPDEYLKKSIEEEDHN